LVVEIVFHRRSKVGAAIVEQFNFFCEQKGGWAES